MLRLARRVAPVLVAASLAVMVPRPANAQVLLGAVLHKFASDVEDIIDKAKNAADFVVVDAGGQVSLIIQQAQAEFQNDLDLAQDRWSAAEANAISNLSSTITILEKHAFKDAKQLADIVQETANTIPFSNKFPQVRSITPDAIATYEDPVFVQLLGNFFDSGRKSYEPSITVDKKPPVKASTIQTNRLGFMLRQDLFPHGAGLSYSSLKIDVPYHHCSFLWFKCRKVASFSTVVTALPPSPGTIDFHTDYETAGKDPKQMTSGTLSLDSHDGDHERVCLHVGPERGYSTIDPYSVRLRNFWGGGDYHDEGSCSTDLVAGWMVGVIQHHWPNCCDGAVHFQLDFIEYKPTIEHHPTDETIKDLKWGQAISRDYDPRGSWKAVYHQFDGQSIPFGPGAPNENKYVSYTTFGHTVVFATTTYDEEHSYFERGIISGLPNPRTVAAPQDKILEPPKPPRPQK